VHDEAIAEFQQVRARASSQLKSKAIYQIGLSLEAANALDRAELNDRKALQYLNPEDMESFNAVQYRLGRVSEALGNFDAAEEHYNQVAASE